MATKMRDLMSWVEVMNPVHICDKCGSVDLDEEQWLSYREIADMYGISVQAARGGGYRGYMGEGQLMPPKGGAYKGHRMKSMHYRLDRVRAWRDPLVREN